MNLLWSPRARRSAEAAVDFIARDRPGAALVWLDGLVERLALVRQFPEQGRVVPEWGEEFIREIYYAPSRIIYEVQADRVEILALYHHRQELPSEVPGAEDSRDSS